MQCANAEPIEIRTACGKIAVVRVPIRHRVFAVGAGGIKDRLPQFFHRGGGRKIREHLFCPLFARHGGDAPLVFVLQLVAQGLDHFESALHPLGFLFVIESV